jgi:hypothetical protein
MARYNCPICKKSDEVEITERDLMWEESTCWCDRCHYTFYVG